jgi:hypothetical protein
MRACKAARNTAGDVRLAPVLRGEHGALAGAGAGVYRLSACASIPCYLCVAVALTVSKALT